MTTTIQEEGRKRRREKARKQETSEANLRWIHRTRLSFLRIEIPEKRRRGFRRRMDVLPGHRFDVFI
jgi:hypothetical protein